MKGLTTTFALEKSHEAPAGTWLNRAAAVHPGSLLCRGRTGQPCHPLGSGVPALQKARGWPCCPTVQAGKLRLSVGKRPAEGKSRLTDGRAQNPPPIRLSQRSVLTHWASSLRPCSAFSVHPAPRFPATNRAVRAQLAPCVCAQAPKTNPSPNGHDDEINMREKPRALTSCTSGHIKVLYT